MQGTKAFNDTIRQHLQGVADKDPLFAVRFALPEKNMGDCTTYVLNQVKKSGQNGFADEEIFNLAMHYYDEDNVEVGKDTGGRVVVNHHVELSDEEKEAAKKQAFDKLIAEETARRSKKTTAKKADPTKPTPPVQSSLF